MTKDKTGKNDRPDAGKTEPLLDPSAFWNGEPATEVPAKELQKPPKSPSMPQDSRPITTQGMASSKGKFQLSELPTNTKQRNQARRPLIPRRSGGTTHASEKNESLTSVAKQWLTLVASVLVVAVVFGFLGWWLIGRHFNELDDLVDNSDQNSPISYDAGAVSMESSMLVSDGGDPEAVVVVSPQGSDPVNSQTEAIEESKRCLAGKGWIYIRSNPSKADVEVDNKHLTQKTPVLVDSLCADEPHQVRVWLERYLPWSKEITIKNNEVYNLDVKLTK